MATRMQNGFEIFVSTIAVFTIVFASAAWGATPAEQGTARNGGLAWLLTNQSGDGGWRSDAGRMELHATASALEAMRRAGISSGYTYSGGVSWLSNAHFDSIDSLSRQIIALEEAGVVTSFRVTRLLAARNDFFRAWGAYPGYEPSFPDTTLALDAILLTGTAYGDTGNSLGYVVNEQNPDGGWPYSSAPSAGTPSRLIPTALTVESLARHRAVGWGVDAWISSGVTWLVGRQLPDGGFADDPSATAGSSLETAMVHRALVEAQAAGNSTALAAQATIDAADDFFIAAQNGDGSWQGEAFVTALALSTLPATVLSDGDADGTPDAVEPLVGTDPLVADSDQLAIGNGDAVAGITTAVLVADAATGEPFNASLAAFGGTPPYSWSITAGRLPDGLSLDENSGAISGTPAAAGLFNFTYLVTDGVQAAASTTGQIDVALSIAPPLQAPGLSGWATGVLSLVLLGSALWWIRRWHRVGAIGASVLLLLAGMLLGKSAPAAPRDVAPLPPEVIERIVSRLHGSTSPSPEAVLERHLAETSRLLERLARRSPRGPRSKSAVVPAAQRMLLQAQRTRLAGVRAETAARLAARTEEFAARGLPVEGFEALAGEVDARFATVDVLFESILKAPDVSVRNRAIESHRALVAALRAARVDDRGFGDRTISTFSSREPGPARPYTASAQEPAYLSQPQAAPSGPLILSHAAAAGGLLEASSSEQPPPPATPPGAASCAYTAADLADDGVDVRLTPEIQELAASLDYAPARIFEYVANEVDFEPYYGSLRGSELTRQMESGGATDQASLLIALLRASNVPARYVRGVIRLQEDAALGVDGRAARWVGAKSSSGAAAVLSQGENPGAGAITGDLGLVAAHVWVETCLPYANYRGVPLNDSGHLWIPLDPSFESRTYQSGIAVGVGFDYADFLSVRRNEMPDEYYGDQVLAAVRGADPNNTLNDVPYTGDKERLRFDILPTSLPYRIDAFTNWSNSGTPDTAILPGDHRYRFDITVNGGDASHSVVWPSGLQERVTLSFKGATPGDHAALDAWYADGDPDSSIPCTIDVLPVVKVEGVELAAGSTSVGLCSTSNTLALSVSLQDGRSNPGDVNATFFDNINAASIYSLQAYGFQVSDQLLAERSARLIDAVNATPDPNSDLEEIEGEFLNIAGLKYMRHISDGAEQIGRLRGQSGDSGHHLGVAGSQAKIEYVFDLPYSVRRQGLLVDVPGGQGRNVDLTTGALDFESFLLSGYGSSNFESFIWQEAAELDAISTVRGLQFANENGIEVLTLTSANWAAESPKFTSNTDPTLDYSAAQVSQIKTNYIDNGFTVTAPRSLMEYDNWRGAVFVAALDALPASAQAGFIISGGYAGGFSVFDPPPGTDYQYTGDTVPNAPGFDSFQTFGGDPVNMVNGNLWDVEVDIEIPSRGDLPFVFERSYNSEDPQDSPIGFGWTHSYNHSLRFNDDERDGVEDEPEDLDGLTSSVTWVNGTGAEKHFAVAGSAGGIAIGATFSAPPSAFLTASRNPDGTYTVRRKDGFEFRFESIAGTAGQLSRLIEITSPHGNAMMLAYDGSGLDRVTDGAGRFLDVTNTAGHITQITDWTGRAWQYHYDGNGDLVAVLDPLAVAGSRAPRTYAYYSSADGVSLGHKLEQRSLARGNGMTFEYYANGKVFRHYNALGETMTFSYNDFRRESITVNERGHTRRFFFDEAGNLARLEDETGATRIYGYDPDPTRIHNRAAKTDPMGLTTAYSYDASGNVTTITHPSGSTEAFSDFTALNQPGKYKNANGNYSLFRYDAGGGRSDVIRLRETGALSFDPTIVDPTAFDPQANASDVLAWSRFSYDAFGNLQTTQRVRDIANAEGPTTTFTYDGNGLYPVQIERCGDKDGDGNIALPAECDSEALVYDALGRLERGIRDDWEIVEYDYDAAGRKIRATGSVGLPRELRYDENDNLVARELVIDWGGTPTLVDQYAATYDMADRLRTELDAGGFVTQYEYDAIGNLLKLTDPDNYSISFEYDENQRLVRSHDKASHSVVRTLDDAGRPVEVADPNGNVTRFEYYSAPGDGRLHRQIDAMGRVVEFEYDANGNIIRLIDNDGQEKRMQYDALDRFVRIVEPAYTDPVHGLVYPVTCYEHGTLGSMVRVQAGRTTDPLGTCDTTDVVTPQADYAYDDFGRRLSETDGNGNTWHFEYDIHDSLVRLEDPKGQVVTRSYDYGSRLVSQSVAAFPGDPNPHVTTFTHNGIGQVARVDAPEVSYAYGYDAAHRMVRITDERDGKSLHYDWSAGGLMNSLRDGAGNVTNYLYDAVGRITGVRAPDGSFVSLRYDAGGRLTEKWFPNGVNAQYTWNVDDTVAQVKNRVGYSDVDIVSQHDYSYDSLGRRETLSQQIGGATGTRRFEYDALGRLSAVRDDGTSALIEGYTYDAFGNRQSLTDGVTTWHYAYDAAHQLEEIRQGSAVGPLTAGYVNDANGNVTRKCKGGTVTRSASACSGNETLDLQYDGLNRVVQADRSGAPGESYAYDSEGRRVRKAVGGAVTNFVYAGPDILATYDETWSAPQAQYVHGPRKDDALVRLDAGGASHYHHDGLGSAVATSDATATLTGTQRFDAWGNTLGTTGAPVAPYGFTGREPEATGLIFYRARYYDPEVGRFLQRDPLGFINGVNRYAYAVNSPTNVVDPNGTVVETVWDVANVGLGVYSLQDNVRSGNWGWAALDAVGLIYDGVATAVPFLPAGASAGFKAARAGNRVVDSVSVGLDVARTADIAHGTARVADVTANAATEGSRIHRQVGEALDAGNALSDGGNNFFRGANRATGPQPDLSWNNAPGVWADLTTPGQWQAHVNRYGGSFGEGIPLLYERGIGLVDTTRLYTGAGTAITGGDLLFGNDPFGTGFDPFGLGASGATGK